MKRLTTLIVSVLAAVTLSAQEVNFLPMPKSVRWEEGICSSRKAPKVKIVESIPEATVNEDEAYRLTISKKGAVIEATTDRGAYWGRQTLEQILEAGRPVRCCEIVDWPSFSIRGYLHDIGRSYLRVDELKREIALLSRYKIDIFHWHLTENQAWRLESKLYPQLTSDTATVRYPGKYYTQAEVREVVDWCHSHGMEVIPEIDVPGHSAAFTRAMGFDMQSERGKKVVKELLEEACDLFHDVPYFHLGTDEVRFSDPGFVPEIVEFVRSKGKKVISYNPGWKYNPGEIDMTHLWSYRGKAQEGIPAIDSRFHYANHFDSFADLVALYDSDIYGRTQEDQQIKGAIVAFWNDRAFPEESLDHDIISQNSFYPYVLTLAERAWCGGGYEYFDKNGAVLWDPSFVDSDSSVPDPSLAKEEYEAFSGFEDRLLYQKNHFLSEVPFPYVKQSNIRWTITDPYPNGGDLSKTFPIENLILENGEVPDTAKVHHVCGAGVYLRHVWGDNLIHGVFRNPQPDGTAYAFTKIWSDEEKDTGLIAEFQNASRSEIDMTPPQGEWDWKGSRIWLNGVLVGPPEWTWPTKEGADREWPLGNMNWTGRQPLEVHLQKGWNTILLKLPVGEFSTKETRLVKWMFAVALTDEL